MTDCDKRIMELEVQNVMTGMQDHAHTLSHIELWFAPWWWDSSDNIVTRLQAGRSGVHSVVGTRDFSLLQIIQTGSEAYPASIQWIMNGKLPGHEASPSPPSSSKVKND
jgi:hypothetical protein